MKKDLYRIMDVNLNRSREGLRVVEDIVRFCGKNKVLTEKLKRVRHALAGTVRDNGKMLLARDARHDVGKEYYFGLEGRKKTIADIVISSFRRVEESLRVMEDISKLIIPGKTGAYKRIRFSVYELEKTIFKKLQCLHNPGPAVDRKP